MTIEKIATLRELLPFTVTLILQLSGPNFKPFYTIMLSPQFTEHI